MRQVKPQQEALTPKQQRVFTAILVLLTLAFSSVFAYAYWRGSQVRARMSTQLPVQVQASHRKRLQVEYVRRRRVQITRGASIQMPRSHFGERWDNSRFWTINKFPEQKKDEPLLSAVVIAYISSPRGWHISHKGVVTVPQDAELGLYQVHYWARKQAHDCFFEVTSESSSGRPS